MTPNAGLLKGFLYLEDGGEASFHDSFVLLDPLKRRQADPGSAGKLALAPAVGLQRATTKDSFGRTADRVSHDGLWVNLFRLREDRDPLPQYPSRGLAWQAEGCAAGQAQGRQRHTP